MKRSDLVLLVVCLGVVAAAAAWRFAPRGEPAEQVPDSALHCGPAKAPWTCFLRVPGATFWMGAQSEDPAAPGYDAAATANEGPMRPVTVGPFWIMRHEAPVGLFRACVNAGKCSEADVLSTGGYATWRPGEAQQRDIDNLPLNGITWKGAVDACAFLGGRLPTEAQWELAARGTDGRRWPWGNRAHCPAFSPDSAFMTTDDRTDTCAQDGPVPMANLPDAGPYGTLGMAGNLWEWTADWYAPDGLPAAGSVDPTGPVSGTTRAQRGGSWTAATPDDLRVTVRGGLDPEAKLNDVGFRCVFGTDDAN